MEEIIQVPGMEQNLINTIIEVEKEHVEDYMTDIMFLIDESASISYYDFEDEMAEVIANIKKCLMEGKNANSIRVCVLGFGNMVPKQAEFVPLGKMNTDYTPCQSQTKLYEVICMASNLMIQHMEEKGVKGVVVVATDGEDIGSEHLYRDAKKAIHNLHEKKVKFQYICIGNKAISCAMKLGLKDKEILRVEDTSDTNKVCQQFAIASEIGLDESEMAL